MKKNFFPLSSLFILMLFLGCNQKALKKTTNTSQKETTAEKIQEKKLTPSDYSISTTDLGSGNTGVTVEFREPEEHTSYKVEVAGTSYEICKASTTLDCSKLDTYTSISIAACDKDGCGTPVPEVVSCPPEADSSSTDTSSIENIFNAEQELLALARSFKSEIKNLSETEELTAEDRSRLEDILAKEDCEIVASFSDTLSLLAEKDALSTGTIVAIVVGAAALATTAGVAGKVLSDKAKKSKDAAKELADKLEQEVSKVEEAGSTDPDSSASKNSSTTTGSSTTTASSTTAASSASTKTKPAAAVTAAKQSAVLNISTRNTLAFAASAFTSKGVASAQSSLLVSDHYLLLGLRETASSADITASYLALRAIHAPDPGGDQTKLTQLEEAYKTLSDPQKRQAYDQKLAQQKALTTRAKTKVTAVRAAAAHPVKSPFKGLTVATSAGRLKNPLAEIRAVIGKLKNSDLKKLYQEIKKPTPDGKTFSEFLASLESLRKNKSANDLQKITSLFEANKQGLKRAVLAEATKRVDLQRASAPKIQPVDLNANRAKRVRVVLLVEDETEIPEEETSSAFDNFVAYCLELTASVSELQALIASESLKLAAGVETE